MENEVSQNFLNFEKNMLSNPKTFFPMFQAGLDGRRKLIWREFIKWQDSGGKILDINLRDIDKDIIVWNLGKEYFAQRISNSAPFTKEYYKKTLSAVFSFMNDRPQFYKFRNLEGMYNPLRLLLYEILCK